LDCGLLSLCCVVWSVISQIVPSCSATGKNMLVITPSLEHKHVTGPVDSGVESLWAMAEV
jgi:hypothetical protein